MAGWLASLSNTCLELSQLLVLIFNNSPQRSHRLSQRLQFFPFSRRQLCHLAGADPVANTTFPCHNFALLEPFLVQLRRPLDVVLPSHVIVQGVPARDF